MSDDLRKILEEASNHHTMKLSENHRKKFEYKLQKEMHSSSIRSYSILKFAASFLVLVGLGISFFYLSQDTNFNTVETPKIESLGSISPELKKIETYYLATINEEILNLQETPENKELLDGYLEKLGELSKEYKSLTEELNTEGLNEKTINALIDNLQLRLKLLYQLKEQLNELKKLNLNQNENIQV